MSFKLITVSVALLAAVQLSATYDRSPYDPYRYLAQFYYPQQLGFYGQQNAWTYHPEDFQEQDSASDFKNDLSAEDDDDDNRGHRHRECHKRGFVCRRNSAVGCYCVSTSTANAYDARRICRRNKMRLLTITSPTRQAALAVDLATLPATAVTQYLWTGGYGHPFYGGAPGAANAINGLRWYWFYPRRWAPIIFESWAATQLAVSSLNKCLALDKTQTFNWVGRDCNVADHFVCVHDGNNNN